MNIPRQYAMVKLQSEFTSWLKENGHENSELLREDVYIFMGEIPNMPEHCVVAAKNSGKILSGLHTDNFIELTEDEV